MKQFSWKFAIITMALLAPVGRSQAGTLDHLVCYRMSDSLAASYTADMLTELQPEFSQQGCVLVKPYEFCVPATKTNVSPPAADPGIGGQALQNDFICYLAKCPKDVPPPDKKVTDQFGVHLHKKYRPVKVCVPAYKQPVECGSVGAHQCAGACPEGQTCKMSPTDICECEPENCEGKPDKHGMCGGTCPTFGEICQPTLSGTGAKICACAPPPEPPCGVNTATGSCGGTCPNANDKCALNAAGECLCQPAGNPCGLDTQGVCSGLCSNPTEQCVSIGSNECACRPAECGRNPVTGTCGGACTDPQKVCRLVPGTNTCGCQ